MAAFELKIGELARVSIGGGSYDGVLEGEREGTHISLGPTHTEKCWRLRLANGRYIHFSPTRDRVEVVPETWKE